MQFLRILEPMIYWNQAYILPNSQWHDRGIGRSDSRNTFPITVDTAPDTSIVLGGSLVMTTKSNLLIQRTFSWSLPTHYSVFQVRSSSAFLHSNRWPDGRLNRPYILLGSRQHDREIRHSGPSEHFSGRRGTISEIIFGFRTVLRTGESFLK